MNYNAYESNTTYGGGGGGGFMAEGSQNSPSGQQPKHETLRPVTIKQVIDGTYDNDSLKIDGATASHLCLVGQIRSIAVQATNITYKIDDGTGSIEVKLWKDTDFDPDQGPTAGLVEGAYCRVWGKPNNYNNKAYVLSNVIRPIVDKNEVSYHLLNATAVHLYYTRGPLNGSRGAATNRGQQQTDANYGGETMSGYSAVTKQVYQFLRSTKQTNEGLHQQEIAARLGLDPAQVAKAGDELLSGGAIYTTVDDQTWAIMEEM
ncbi:replication protein-like protein A 32 kDa subunit [Periconia macrospinosa]|uniref:Replication protein-like protein A 32 kDa subunit n=1 Tax=Periconia macrospinosa TaxID=97972 RepID=A0A2V1DYU8_9PLEO|nr:replication protein-like protein A 32 kDa subunit [Periconia macrospinosa]